MVGADIYLITSSDYTHTRARTSPREVATTAGLNANTAQGTTSTPPPESPPSLRAQTTSFSKFSHWRKFPAFRLAATADRQPYLLAGRPFGVWRENSILTVFSRLVHIGHVQTHTRARYTSHGHRPHDRQVPVYAITTILSLLQLSLNIFVQDKQSV